MGHPVDGYTYIHTPATVCVGTSACIYVSLYTDIYVVVE